MMDKLESARKANQEKTDDTSNQPSSSSTSKPATSEAGASARPNITVTPAVKPAQSSPNPFTQLGVQNTRGARDQSASTGSSRPARKRSAPDADDTDSASTPRKTSPPQPAPLQPRKPPSETDEDYAHRVLSQVFRVSVDPHFMANAQSQRLAFLPNLNQELNDSGDALKLSIGTLDQAIIEACTSWTPSKPLFEYLLPCWKRAVKAASTAKNTSAARHEILEEAKRLCMSNCLFALTMPALYGFVYDYTWKICFQLAVD